MNDHTKIALIDELIADAIEFGDIDSGAYLYATINAIGSIIKFGETASRHPPELHELIGKEAARYRAFRDKHYEKCKNPTDYNIRLKGTGIGESIEVSCPICGESENITDSSQW